MLGDIKEGNGAPSLCTFGERITPNQHKLAREFVLLDNTYCSGILSAYTKRRAVISTQYNQTSILRSMELILDLPPMNQLDASATPMSGCFTNQPDFTPFTALPTNIPLDEMNYEPKKVADSILRRDAYASARLPLQQPDKCPEDVLNRILWHAMMGTKEPYPEWAVTMRDDD